MREGKVISVINQKGGVAKTTTVTHMGAALAELGFKVLLIDLDISQANLTVSMIGPLGEEGRGVLHAFFKDNTLNEVTYPTSNPNLFVVPSEIKYKGRTIPLDVALNSQPGKDLFLKKLIKPIRSEYDFIIIDNGPTLGTATVNSLVASQYFIVPTLADYLSLVGVQKTMETIELIQENLDHEIENLGLILTMIDGREAIGRDSLSILNNAFEGKVFNTFIQRNSKFKEIAQKQQTIFDVEKKSGKGNKNYRQFAQEILERLEIKAKKQISVPKVKKQKSEQKVSMGGAQ